MPDPTPDRPTDPGVSDYRLAPALGVRFVGGLLVVVAVLVFAATAVIGLLDLPVWLLLVVAAVGVAAGLAGGYVLTRRVAVVRLGPDGYRVRLIRGVGVAAAGWKEVDEAVTASPAGVPVVVLRLSEDRTTTIPVQALAADREEFVRDLRAHLQRGQGRRPL